MANKRTKIALAPDQAEFDDVTGKKMKLVDISKLHLDLANPRLPQSVKKTPKGVLTWIAKSTAIEDLMNAIATNGFFPGEPVVAYPHPTKDDEFIVIEGNRRLTACKLIQDPYECEKPSAQMLLISEQAKHTPTEIPVVVSQSRSEVLPYLGFRHITGIKEWDPLAKARYIKQLFDITPTEAPISDRYQSVAKSIGSRRDHIKRNLDALAVYEAIEEAGFFEIPNLGEETIKFAVLSTALADDRIGGFVGTSQPVVQSDGSTSKISTDPIANPEVLKTESIGELARWLFEKKEGKTVVGESRRLRDLAAVIDSPKALNALRGGSSLSYAYRLTSGVGKDFLQHLYTAQSALEEAASLVANVEFEDEAYSLAKEQLNLIRHIGKSLKDKKAEGEDDF